jgi:hypothetical protein
MNYTALQAAVEAYLHRTDLGTTDLIERARVRIGTELRSTEQLVTTTLVSFTNGVAALPTDYEEMLEVRSGTTPLRAVNYSELGYYLGNSTPAVYAIYNRSIHIPGCTTADLWYWRIEATLTVGTTEHPTMAAFPQLWIYAAVAEGARRSDDWEKAATMEQEFSSMVTSINARARDLRHGVAPAMIDSGRYLTFGDSGL